jgi:hypothetical protein
MALADTWNPQDAFAKLVESCRLGQVGKPIAAYRPNGIKMQPHRPDCDPNVPCFFVSKPNDWLLDNALLAEATETILDGTFALPYDAFALMKSYPGGHPSLIAAPGQYSSMRHSYVLVFEREDAENVLIHPFMRNTIMDTWARQVFDIRLEMRGADSVIMCEPIGNNFPEPFLDGVQGSLEARVDEALCDIHRLMRGRPGNAAAAAPGPLTIGVQKRRAKMGLEPVETVRLIDLNAPPRSASNTGTGRGSGKRPHYRRGSWVREHIRNGKTIPAGPRRATQVRGGSSTPPWYEVIVP